MFSVISLLNRVYYAPEDSLLDAFIQCHNNLVLTCSSIGITHVTNVSSDGASLLQTTTLANSKKL